MKKIIAVLSAAALILSLAACGTKTEEETTTEATTEALSEFVTDEARSDDTEATADGETEAAEQESETAPEINADEMTTEQIVELYNTSVNKVKSTAKQITRNYSHVSCPDNMVELPSSIEGIGKSAMKTFVKGSDEPQVWTNKEDFKIGFPVGNEDYSSHLTADMVKSATVKDNGTTYQIEIKLYDDKITSPKKGQGYAGVFNTVSAETFEGISIPGVTFNKVDINGVNGSISATIEKDSGNLTKLTVRNTDIMSINVKVGFSTLDCKIGLVNDNDYSIKY